MAVDLLIKNGLIVDGTGGKPYRGDVAIDGGKIVGVGDVRESGRQVLDAGGLAVAPGFWDIHTHYDAHLLWDPTATSSCWHGATTIVTGNCGYTIAPCRSADADWMVRALGQVEAMNADSLRRTLPWAWESFGQYLDHLDRGLGINVAPMVGHTAVRRYVMGEDASHREATAGEIAAMQRVVAESVQAGAMGFSTSRVASHKDGEGLPVPSRLSSLPELYALVEPLAAASAGFVEIAGAETYRVSEDGMTMLIELARHSRRPVCWNRIVQAPNDPDSWRRELDRMAGMRARGLLFFGCGHTQGEDLEFMLEDTAVFDRWATWRRVLDAPERRTLLKDPALRDTLKEEMKDDPQKRFGRPWTWDRILFVRSTTGKYRHLDKRTLKDIAAEDGRHPVDILLDVALDEDLKTQFRLMDSRNADSRVIPEILKAPHVVVGQSDAGAHQTSLVNTSFGTQLLGYWVRERQGISLEAAVRCLTAVPAEEVGATDRGYLKEGLAADITIFDPATVAPGERVFVNDLPGGEPRLVQHATGIEYTIVNGQVVLQGGKHTGALSGRTIRSSNYGR